MDEKRSMRAVKGKLGRSSLPFHPFKCFHFRRACVDFL
jgi:hypothetical protein